MTFFKTILAAAIGFFLALALVFFFFLISFGSAALSSGKSRETIESNSVLRLNLEYAVPEQSYSGWPAQLNPMALDFQPAIGLNDLCRMVREAAADDRIKGIQLDLGYNPNGLTKLTELADELEQFRSSGKFVLAYGQNITQKSYYLASAADSVYLHPAGMLDLKGFSADLSFYSRALDKLGVEVQVFYDGKYKSATEPFRLERMSEENRRQVREFLDEVWSLYLETVGAGRNLDRTTLQQAADSLSGYFAGPARELGLVDGLLYPDEFADLLRNKLQLDSEDKINYVTAQQYWYSRFGGKSKSNKKSSVAVIYAEGDIGFGMSGPGQIGSDDLSRLLRKAREDKDIKAVVLRINSPGGIAPASDLIYREAKLLAEEKTLVVSMGDVAASAGYQIAAPADRIVAEPNTLTGSIGVFLLLPNLQPLLEDRLGITSDTVNTGAMADFPTVSRPVSAAQRRLLQRAVDSTYAQFKRYVGEGRGLSPEAVEEVAQGRIWTGTQALDRGLVDTLGTLQTAIELAASLARLGSDYSIREWPKEELSPIEEMLLTALQSRASLRPSARSAGLVPSTEPFGLLWSGPLAELARDHARMLEWAQSGEVQARLPFQLTY